ncbi:uncharacterized protein OCT59_002914 [Rhizophagus irregularis]|uniref:uncharacterized protein n=1 Tax=Rhizophagus irregularis TaxID=588596 RepID=UPI00332EC5A1|nr:hypothetical protein OCT59_002914 [Rhizophagus irregularis]
MTNIEYQNKNVDSDNTDDVDITVKIDDLQSKVVSINLNLKYKLSKVREILKQNSKVKMDDTLTFAYKISQNNNTRGSLAEIAREDEEKKILENIINKKSKTLYLTSELNWKCFKNRHKLEYGRDVTFEKANNRAFTIVDCEMNEIVDGYENRTIKIDSEENKIIENDLLLIADIDIPNFEKLGVSFKKSNIKNSNVTINTTYNIIEHKKMSLKFKLKPTIEFIEAVRNVINSNDPRKFKDVISEFGQFISKEIILGIQSLNMKCEKKYSKSSNTNYSSKFKSFKLFGGKEACSNNFNETDWVESLKDFKYWSCINFKEPVNIFQLLPEDLRKQILSLTGKKILFTSVEDYSYKLLESGSQLINIPEKFLEILQCKDSDCNIFATVVDKNEKDIFNCQVVWPPNEDPKLLIHCIQKKFRKHECKLNIRWMIIGYDINFNFNNSEFNFKLKVLRNIFNASNHQTIVIPLELEYNPSVLCFGIPVLRENKYHGPIFLKQKISGIKIKYIDIKCNQEFRIVKLMNSFYMENGVWNLSIECPEKKSGHLIYP